MKKNKLSTEEEYEIERRLISLGYMNTYNLDSNTNYIVSGLERSGTSLMMQILKKGNVPIAYSQERKPDIHNPIGYYELEDGKIIDKLITNRLETLAIHRGKFIKITAYGTTHLSKLYFKHKIIFMERDIEEILDSTEKMSKDKFDREETKRILIKLLESTKEKLDRLTKDIIYVNYNNLLENPDEELSKVKDLIIKFDVDRGKKAIDKNLYRNRR